MNEYEKATPKDEESHCFLGACPEWAKDVIDKAGAHFKNLQISYIIGNKDSHIIAFTSYDAIIKGQIEGI